MFNIGFAELCVIAIVALLFVGPQRLPELMRQFGRFFVHVRRMSTDVKSTVDTVMRDAENTLLIEEEEKRAKISQQNPLNVNIDGSEPFVAQVTPKSNKDSAPSVH